MNTSSPAPGLGAGVSWVPAVGFTLQHCWWAALGREKETLVRMLTGEPRGSRGLRWQLWASAAPRNPLGLPTQLWEPSFWHFWRTHYLTLGIQM